eukprot:UN17358
MPWQLEAMKDVLTCDKPIRNANCRIQRIIKSLNAYCTYTSV